MAYIGIEFCETTGGGVALVHETWLTPRKKEVFWPNYKQQSQFNRAVTCGQAPEDNWKLYAVKRCFFESGKLKLSAFYRINFIFLADNFSTALRKIKQAEVTSDIHSDLDESIPTKRRRKLRVLSEEDNSSSDTDIHTSKNKVLPRPEKLFMSKGI